MSLSDKPIQIPETSDFFGRFPMIPVVVIRELSETEPLLSALCDGQLPVAEITFRTDCAGEAIRLASEKFPDMTVGAGTVIHAGQAREAIEAGASFIVSPGLSESVFQVCREADVPYLPGCVTPTELMRALELGIRTVKFFPAGVFGGLSAIKALASPFPQMHFVPTGGVDLGNIREFLAFDRIVAVGGSFILKGDIRENCRRLWEVLRA